MIFISSCPEDTFQLGKKLGEKLPQNSVVCFFGDLAAGKTTMIKGVVAGSTGESPSSVSSPTFVLLNIYEGPKPVYHFDLYRLKDKEEFLGLGFEEYWSATGLCCIEWSERIADILPENCIQVHMEATQGNERKINIRGVFGL